MADEFADYFSTVADVIGREADNLTEEKCINNRGIEMKQARHETDSFSFNKIKRGKVYTALKELDTLKSIGYDEVSSEVLAKEIATPLTDIFNQVIKDGELLVAYLTQG